MFTRFPLKYLCFFYLIFTHTDMVILSASGIQEVSSVIHTHTHTHTHMYIYIFTHSIYIYTHTHTHRQTWSCYRPAVFTWFLRINLYFLFSFFFTHTDMVILSASGMHKVSSDKFIFFIFFFFHTHRHGHIIG